MTYREAYEKIRNAASALNADKVEGHIAVQVNLCDEDAAGILYIEVKDGCVFIEPYDYVDRDAIFFLNTEDAVAAVSGKTSFAALSGSGKLSVEGNYERAFELDKVFAPVKKAARAAGNSAVKEPSVTAKPKANVKANVKPKTKSESPAKKASPAGVKAAKEKTSKGKATKEKTVKEKVVKAPKAASEASPKAASKSSSKAAPKRSAKKEQK